MKLFFQYCSYVFSNCYILGAESAESGKQAAAIIIDPGSIEKSTVKTIEENNFDLKAVLLTHEHFAHVQGLRTLMKIYNPEIFAVNQNILEHKANMVKNGDIINIAGLSVEVISIPGHSSDSVVYRIDNLLFTGDVLTAGLVGSTASAYGTAIQMDKLQSRVLSLPGDYVVLPGHGPPSTLEGERRFNKDILSYDQNRSRKPNFRIDV